MIPTKNIYYMLTYAFELLKEKDFFSNASIEDFDNYQNLLSKIMICSLKKLKLRGLYKTYIPVEETVSCLRGKINISETIRFSNYLNRNLVCDFEDFSENNILNQIIKSSLNILIKSDINSDSRTTLIKYKRLFERVDTVDLKRVNWNFKFNKNNKIYYMLISFCKMIFDSSILSTKTGEYKLRQFFDDNDLARLYEKFLLEFYREHLINCEVNAKYINWQLDDDNTFMLPLMKSDVLIETDKEILIIDAKYYGDNTQEHFDKRTVRSGHLYQIINYVKNKQEEVKDSKKVYGMLLYAKTDNEIQPDTSYSIMGNKIYVKNIDLNNDFETIKNDLMNLVNNVINL